MLSLGELDRLPPIRKTLFDLILGVENISQAHETHGKLWVQLNRPPQQRDSLVRTLLVAQRLERLR